MSEDLAHYEPDDWKLKRELRLSQSSEQAWKERALKAERGTNDFGQRMLDLERDAAVSKAELAAYVAETKEELAQSHYYRECRDYWRQQAESLAALVDRHNREVHQAMSHEQLFQPPKPPGFEDVPLIWMGK
jgi:hypothetical protein